MSHVHHELHEEFPEEAQFIHNLKVKDHHFAKIADRYHDTNRQIHRIEAGVTPTSDDVLEELKKTRLKLKDEIATMIARAKAA